jgi:TPR repeat protein
MWNAIFPVKKRIASLAILATLLCCACQTTRTNEFAMTTENLQVACTRGEAASCAALGDLHERSETGQHDYAKALEFYEKSCALDDYPACANAARILSFIGWRSPVNIRKQWQYAQKSCNANVAKGCAYLSTIYRGVSARFAGVEKDTEKAFALAEKACQHGDGFACDRLGDMHASEEGAGSDPDRAQQFFAKAAKYHQTGCDKDYAIDCFRLGGLHEYGLGVGQDTQKAILLLEKSCDAELAAACKELSYIYKNSNHVTNDGEKAAKYDEKACDFGDAYNCYSLGKSYVDGDDDLAKDSAKAARLWRKGCDFDSDDSCESLGDLYMAGATGILQDKARAADLYKKALSLRTHSCEKFQIPYLCETLGDNYKEGKITPSDSAKSAAAYTLALAQWRRECDQDDGIACAGLAHMYEEGKGVKKDKQQALRYYDKACPRYYGGCVLKGVLERKTE